jgi:hypothetical protein
MVGTRLGCKKKCSVRLIKNKVKAIVFHILYKLIKLY